MKNLYYCATCDRKMEPVTDINVHRCDGCGFEIGDRRMKKYDCPDCGAEMKNGTFVNIFLCTNCGLTIEEDALERITNLKSKLNKMRNCENCVNQSEYVNSSGANYCGLGLSAGHECLHNSDRKHWRMEE